MPIKECMNDPTHFARLYEYRDRRFPSETIELCVRWYITYRLSYRDLAAMMAARGILISRTTIMRWVLHYVPEYERRWDRFARPVNSSWRMDETAVPVRTAAWMRRKSFSAKLSLQMGFDGRPQ
jgi:transposase-like protein